MYISIFIYIYMYIIIIPITNVYTNTVINAAVTKEMKYLKFLCNYKTLIFKYLIILEKVHKSIYR